MTTINFEKALTLVPYSSSANNFVTYVADSASNKEKLFDDIRHCRIDERKCRFNIWRMLLGVIPITSGRHEKIQQITDQREKYKVKRAQAYTVIAAGPKKQSAIPRNPLMKAMVKAPKVQEVDDDFLKDEIRKDVERTYQQIEFFQQESVLKLLSNVLFVWCKRNPQVSYKQGMNEVLASIVYVYFEEAYASGRKPDGLEDLSEQMNKIYTTFNSVQFAEVDIYCVFEKVMNIQHQMYKTQTDSNLKGVINPNSKNNTPILQRIINIIDQKLKSLDIELFRAIKMQDVQPKTFLLRWIRCMHTREFSLENSFLIWDSIFLDYYQSPASKEKGQFQFIDAMCVAMFVYLRSIALTRETSYQILQTYQKYPHIKKGGYLEQLISLAWSLCESLRQPANLVSEDWVGQHKSDNQVHLLKNKDPILKQTQPEPKAKQNPVVQPKQKQQVKQTVVVSEQKKSEPQSFDQIQQKSKDTNTQPKATEGIYDDFNFPIVLAPQEWHLLVEKLQKSLALNNDEQSRKYVLEGIEILKSKVDV